jgi:hypothetical protein
MNKLYEVISIVTSDSFIESSRLNIKSLIASTNISDIQSAIKETVINSIKPKDSQLFDYEENMYLDLFLFGPETIHAFSEDMTDYLDSFDIDDSNEKQSLENMLLKIQNELELLKSK